MAYLKDGDSVPPAQLKKQLDIIRRQTQLVVVLITPCQVNSIDTYSESYMNLLLGIEEEFNDLGLVGSEDIVEFYTSSIFLARYGYLNLENSKGKDFKFGFKEFGIILEAVNEYKREDLDINLATQLKISKLRSVSQIGRAHV